MNEPLHRGRFGATMMWSARLLLVAIFAVLVSFARDSAAMPACGPWPAPDRWPTLIPPLVVAGIASLVGCVLLGLCRRSDSAAVWFFASGGSVVGAIGVHFMVLLYMSFTTLC